MHNGEVNKNENLHFLCHVVTRINRPEANCRFPDPAEKIFIKLILEKTYPVPAHILIDTELD